MYNEAFIIDQNKYYQLIAQDPKSKEILKPLLRGKDIKRYEAKWAGRYLIFIPWHFPLHKDGNITGVSEKAEELFKKEYPAIYNHLEGHKEKLSLRNKAETCIRYEWYALQRCAATYYKKFSQPKIVWTAVNSEYRFTYIGDDVYFNNSLFMITGNSIKYLLAIFNSNLMIYYLKLVLGGDEYEYGSSDHFETLPIPIPTTSQEEAITNLVNQIIEAKKRGLETSHLEDKIDELVYELYGLSEEEIELIE